MDENAISHRVLGATHRLSLALFISLALTAAGANACRAQCIEFSERATQENIDAFVRQPSFLLERYRNDKDKLKYVLSSYIATNPAILSSVQKLIADASSAERPQIGAALRLAESRCTPTKPSLARKINEFVQKLGDSTVLAGYSTAGEDQTAPRLQTHDKGPNRGGELMSEEWKAKLPDPFKPMPLPR